MGCSCYTARAGLRLAALSKHVVTAGSASSPFSSAAIKRQFQLFANSCAPAVADQRADPTAARSISADPRSTTDSEICPEYARAYTGRLLRAAEPRSVR